MLVLRSGLFEIILVRLFLRCAESLRLLIFCLKLKHPLQRKFSAWVLMGRWKLALRNYEIMFLLDSGKYATDPNGVTDAVNVILDKIGAEVVAARPWMDGKLAYEIEGHRKGLHYLVYAKADSGNVQKLQRLCKLSDVVLRHLCILPPDQLFDLMAAALTEPEAAPASEEGEEAGKSEETGKGEEATKGKVAAESETTAENTSTEETTVSN